MRSKLLWIIAPSLLAVACGVGRPVDVSGTWTTAAPLPYVVESTAEASHGSEVAHQLVDLRERTAVLRWELEQRADGIVTGTNHWVSRDQNGREVLSAAEPLLGTFDGRRLVLVEPGEEGPQLRFELEPCGKDKLSGSGHGVGEHQLMAIPVELIRSGAR